jgi:hypothetical protein
MSVHGKDVAQDLVQPVAGGIERDRLAQQCLRLPWIAVQQHRGDLVQPALGRLGIGGGGAAVGYCRVFGVALGLEQVGEAPMAVGHHGCQLETGGCLSEAAAAQQCQVNARCDPASAGSSRVAWRSAVMAAGNFPARSRPAPCRRKRSAASVCRRARCRTGSDHCRRLVRPAPRRGRSSPSSEDEDIFNAIRHTLMR